MTYNSSMELRKLFGLGQGGFLKKESSVVGIDIGYSSAKVVQLRKDGGKIVLETYGELATGPYLKLSIGQAATLPPEKLVELLRDLFKEANITTTFGTLAIPLRSSLIVTMELPDAGRAELNKMIPIEARKYVPVPIAEVALDWWVIPSGVSGQMINGSEVGEAPSNRMIEVLVAAIHKETVSQYQNLAKHLGLQANSFEIETFSAIRAALPPGALGATAILDLGAGTAKLSIVDGGVARAAHTINKGAQDITTAIARSQSISFAKAEEIKRAVGLLPRTGDVDVSSTVSPIVEYLLAEANRVMLNYEQRHKRAIDKVILTGGGAALKGLTQAAEGVIAVPLVLANPFAKIEAPAFLAPVLAEAGPSFNTALGLALRLIQEI